LRKRVVRRRSSSRRGSSPSPSLLVRHTQASRTERAKKLDVKLKAKLATSTEQWVKAPNRYDLKGVDYPQGKTQKTEASTTTQHYYPIVKISRGIFGNVLTAPKAIILEKKGRNVKVFWIDGYQAGTTETISLDTPSLAVYPVKREIAYKDAKEIAKLQKQYYELQRKARKKAASREEIVKYARQLRKTFKNAKVASHGFSEHDKGAIEIVFDKPVEEKKAKEMVTKAMRQAGYKGDLKIFVIHRAVEARPVNKEAEKAEQKLPELKKKIEKLEKTLAKKPGER